MSKKTILILSYTHLDSDPRIRRQFDALKDEFNVITCGLSPIKAFEKNFISIYKVPPFSLLRKVKRLLQFVFRSYDSFYWDDFRKQISGELAKINADIIIANDIHTLPLALSIAPSSKVLFDAHEFHPEEFNDQLWWYVFHKPYLTFLCRKYIPKAKTFTTVSDGIAEKYQQFCGIKPTVITNASSFKELTPAQMNANKIRLIHHGAALKSRHLEQMIDLMGFLDKSYELDLMLTKADPQYYKDLIKKASHFANIRFIEPVPFSDICQVINKYDIGLYILKPSNVNHIYSLPNKFFEFVQGRLCLAVSPTPEMANIVKNYNLGVVSEDYDPSSMAEAIKKLDTNSIRFHKEQSHLHALALSSDGNKAKLLSLINSMVKN